MPTALPGSSAGGESWFEQFGGREHHGRRARQTEVPPIDDWKDPMSASTRTVVLGMLSLGIVAIYAFGSGRWVQSGDDWYRQLRQPAWQPPDAVFGIAWSYNFLMLAVAGFIVASRGTAAQQTTWLVVFAVSVVAALSWAWLFYSRHALLASGVALAIAAALTIVLTIVAWRVEWWLGVAMIPYALWVCIATSLAFGYAALN
jgi:tryptophan-rich sensory protein